MSRLLAGVVLGLSTLLSPVAGGRPRVQQGRSSFVTLGTAPVGGAFQPVGNALASVLNDHKGENKWKVGSHGHQWLAGKHPQTRRR